MENDAKIKRKSLYDQSFLLGKFLFTFVVKIFIIGYRNDGLKQSDLYRCPRYDEADKVCQQLARQWDKEKTKANPSFFRALLFTFGMDYIIPILAFTFEECVVRIGQPICLGLVIRYFSDDPSVSYWTACWSGAGVCLFTLVYIHIHHPAMLCLMRQGMRLRTASSAMVYRKALRLNQSSVGQTTVGQIVNIMSNDVNRLDSFAYFFPFFVVAPLQTAIVVYIVWTYLGVSCFIGIGLLLLFIPFQAFMGKMFAIVRLRTARFTDTRLRFMNEVISGMRVIKMYCWEKPFAERIAQARKSEVKQIRRSCFLKGVNLSVFFIATRVILFVCFVAYVLLDEKNVLSAEAVFVSMALFNAIRVTVTSAFPAAIEFTSEARITCQRIQELLMMEEVSSKESQLDSNGNKTSVRTKSDKSSKEAKLTVQNISAKWTPEPGQPTLKDISVKLEPGDLLAVIGPVGSGKSSFLMTLLGELPVNSGDITLEGELSYAGQDSWIFNDTVRNNILFGMDYDPKRYQKVIEVCALTRDLELMPFGDRTLVGEKGVQLSGGQKARINLARAVYRNAGVYLLDDPLSAVDTAVAEHIFEKCILDNLKSKIRILVTHQIQFIQKATKILVLKDGQSVAYGSYNELQYLGIDFMSLVTSDGPANAETNNLSKASSLSSLHLSISRSQSVASSHAEFVRSTSEIEQFPTNPQVSECGKIEEEQLQRGSIEGKIYLEYIRAGAGPFLWIVTVVFSLLSQTLFHGSDIFLTMWTNKNQALGVREDQKHDITIYSVLMGTMFLTTIIRSVSFFEICMRTSENLHNHIFVRLLRTPVSFFDTNPVGRILNRFAKDLGTIDENLPETAFDLNLTISQAIGVVVTVSLVNWYLVLPAIVLTVLVSYMRNVYIISARDIRRYEGIARSPVYSAVSTTMNGLASIRAFGAQEQFRRQFTIYQNDHSATWFLYCSTTRALGLLVDWACLIYTTIIIVVVLMATDMQGGSAGLAISSGLMLAGMTQWGVRQTAEFESQMTSVERIVEYKYLEQEAPTQSIKDLKPNKEWPAMGAIHFDDMSLTYGDNEPVLKNLNCKIGGGEKIGIVGRTGAGKSSMIAALFRLTESKGVIRIDGVDIQSIGLDDLRQKISIIPQDPVIYSGTIRYNLDPFNQYSDEEIWSALDQVQLKAPVNNFAGKLDAQLSESGGNLSVGQRQLICLARAILRRNRILVLDEATANIDHQTDNLIQETIRTQFVQCTVLTIAHRLNTIIDSDRVLVLDAGEIVEFDIPYLLLQRQGSFYDMCQKTGPRMYAHLLRMAKSAYENKNNQKKDKLI